ncbi:MAG TPA: 2Fe-2S iron-sulfur cluster-binding protein, partial [Burkholderiales bacterium]|nr:2Fe-2S iron-sulfur cluster-binding protein [Burkholderiales bacterium]
MKIVLEGHDEPIPVEAGDTILASLLRAGVAFPFSCQSGNCGTCKCELVSGDVLDLEYSEHALAPEERARGVILACRTQVWDDTVVRRIDAEELVVHPSRVMRCRVLELDELTHDIKGVRLAVEAGGPMRFSAGQYAEVEFAPGLSRHYSMASTPEEPELVFHVRHLPGGRTSGYVATQLKVGDRVKVSGPLGIS